MERRPFSKVVEERPGLTMRRLTPEDIKTHQVTETGTMVGIFNAYGHKKLLAIMDLDDVFDRDGNRFYND